jgi:hypothetical protein
MLKGCVGDYKICFCCDYRNYGEELEAKRYADLSSLYREVDSERNSLRSALSVANTLLKAKQDIIDKCSDYEATLEARIKYLEDLAYNCGGCAQKVDDDVT